MVTHPPPKKNVSALGMLRYKDHHKFTTTQLHSYISDQPRIHGEDTLMHICWIHITYIMFFLLLVYLSSIPKEINLPCFLLVGFKLFYLIVFNGYRIFYYLFIP